MMEYSPIAPAWNKGATSMTASKTQGERTASALHVESMAEETYSRSQTFRNVFAFVGGIILGFLPLCLVVLNHLVISLPLFPFNSRLAFCQPQTHLPYAKIGWLDTGAFFLSFIEAGLGIILAMIGWMTRSSERRSRTIFCATGLVLAVVCTFFFYEAFIFPISFQQCFFLRD
jgi:hypothetical protein